MSTEWSRTTLGSCADFFSGGTPRKSNSEYWGGTIPWFSGKDLKSFYLSDSEDHVTEEGVEAGSRLMPVGTILLLVRGMTLHNDIPIGVLTRAATFNQDIKALRARNGVLQSFLAHWLVSQKRRLLSTVHAAGHGTGVLATDRLQALELELPSPGEQAAISNVFDLIEDKIEQNRRTGRALEGLARATFKAWFVDFEPVKAKAAGAVGFPGMPPAAFAALPDRLIESSLGAVPEGWVVRPIGEAVTVKGGGTPSTKMAEYWDGGTHCWATPKDLSGLEEPVLLDTERHITDLGAETISSGLLPKDTVLLSSRAPIGYTALAKVPTAVNQGFIAMVCDGPLSPLYVLHWVRSSLDEIRARASGTTFPEVSKAGFRPITLVVPPAALVQAFDAQIGPLFDLVTSNTRETAKLAALRDYLLPRLLSGEVRVGV